MDESAEGVREGEILTTCVSDAQQGAGQMRTVREVRRFFTRQQATPATGINNRVRGQTFSSAK